VDAEVATVDRVSLTDNVARLKVEYSDSDTGLPRQFLLKAGEAGGYQRIDNEADFYSRLISRMPDPPTIQCYDAYFDEDARRAHVILEDLGETHFHREAGDVSGLGEDSMRLAERLASFHTYWWDHPELGKTVNRFPKVDIILWGGGPSGFLKGLPDFLERAGDRLPDDAPDIYRTCLASYPFKDLVWHRPTFTGKPAYRHQSRSQVRQRLLPP